MKRKRLSRTAGVAVCLGLIFLAFAGSARQKELKVEGTYVHRETGREFPERVGEYRREKIQEYGPYDIGIGYNLESHIRPVSATVYLYPMQDIPFDAELEAIEERHDNFELAFERDIQLTKERNNLGCRLAGMSYDSVFARYPMTVKSYLLVCDDPPWRVKWRITHPAMTDTDIEAVVDLLAVPLTVRD